MVKQRHITFIGTAFLILSCGALYSLRPLPLLKRSSPAANVSSHAVSLEDFSFSAYSGPAQRRFTVTGHTLAPESKRWGLFVVEPIKVMRIAGAEITFYDSGNPVSTIRAKSATLPASYGADNAIEALSGRIDFAGGVTVVTQERRVLTCDRARWDNKVLRLSAKGNCVLRYEGTVVRADSLDTDIALKSFRSRNERKNRLRALAGIL